jgi:hypothetical protein
MSIKNRVERLEQRAEKEMSIEQVHARMRILFGKMLGVDLSAASDEEATDAGYEIMRRIVEGETGQVCSDWPRHRLLNECRILSRGWQ